MWPLAVQHVPLRNHDPHISFSGLAQIDPRKAKQGTISEALLGKDYDIKPEVGLVRSQSRCHTNWARFA
jgi:hypothetical protein